MAESEEELKSLWMRAKEETERNSAQKTKIMASCPIISHTANRKEKMEAVTDFIILGSKITVDSDGSQEIKRHLPLEKAMPGISLVVQWLGHCASTSGGTGSIPGWGNKIPHAAGIAKFFYLKKKKKKAMPTLDSILKSRDITLLTKVSVVSAMVFPAVMYRCESWTIKKVEC